MHNMLSTFILALGLSWIPLLLQWTATSHRSSSHPASLMNAKCNFYYDDYCHRSCWYSRHPYSYLAPNRHISPITGTCYLWMPHISYLKALLTRTTSSSLPTALQSKNSSLMYCIIFGNAFILFVCLIYCYASLKLSSHIIGPSRDQSRDFSNGNPENPVLD